MTHRSHTYALILLGCSALVVFILLAWSILFQSFLYQCITAFDTTVQSIVRDYSSLEGGRFFYFFTYLASVSNIVIVLIALCAILMLLNEYVLTWLFFSGTASSILIFTFVKVLLLRSRPDYSLLSIVQTGYAFPSGHATLAMVFYGFLGYVIVHALRNRSYKHIITVVTAIIIFLIGFSRIYLGLHWPSDVIAGWLLGSVLLIALIMIFRHFHRREHVALHKVPHMMLSLIIIILLASALVLAYVSVTRAAELRSIMDSVAIQ
jgi:membrane-associated phospholipid phosphatase